MGYRFYENWTADDKAVIHRKDCGYCNFGKGCHANPLGDKERQVVRQIPDARVLCKKSVVAEEEQPMCIP